MEINYDKENGLIPAIIQDAKTDRVLMLGYMNQEALQKTQQEGRVTFFSRSKNRLWTKGETSGNFLEFLEAKVDCDGDALLIKANPFGPTCHTGADTCWNEKNQASPIQWIADLETLIQERKRNPQPGSYTSEILDQGVAKAAQKVGEEAVEWVLEAKDGEEAFIEGCFQLCVYQVVTFMKILTPF